MWLLRFLAALSAIVMMTPSAAFAAPDAWTGTVRTERAVVYASPGGSALGALDSGTSVTVSDWQEGPALTFDNFTWAHIGDGRFVHSSVLRHAPLASAPPHPPQVVSAGHWADANLTMQILTLYSGDQPVRQSLMSSGRPAGSATESHLGVWPIASRVANETMRGDGYNIIGVLFTQYFTSDSEAIHLNYWLTDDERGIPRSHGCLGVAYDDAHFAWDFLTIGSPVAVHF
jgi:hypothetical protein